MKQLRVVNLQQHACDLPSQAGVQGVDQRVQTLTWMDRYIQLKKTEKYGYDPHETEQVRHQGESLTNSKYSPNPKRLNLHKSGDCEVDSLSCSHTHTKLATFKEQDSHPSEILRSFGFFFYSGFKIPL